MFFFTCLILLSMISAHKLSWAPPAFLEGGGQIRARGRHFTAANTLSAFGRFNQWGAHVSFRPIRCPRFRRFGRFNQWAVGAVRFQPIQPVGGAHVCKLLITRGGAIVIVMT